MALTQRTRIREVLFVQDDKTLQWFAHQVPITEILDDSGTVISAQYGGAEALDVAGAGQVLDPAVVNLGQQLAAAQAQVQSLTAVSDENATLKNQVDSLTAANASLQQQLSDAQATPAPVETSPPETVQ